MSEKMTPQQVADELWEALGTPQWQFEDGGGTAQANLDADRVRAWCDAMGWDYPEGLSEALFSGKWFWCPRCARNVPESDTCTTGPGLWVTRAHDVKGCRRQVWDGCETFRLVAYRGSSVTVSAVNSREADKRVWGGSKLRWTQDGAPKEYMSRTGALRALRQISKLVLHDVFHIVHHAPDGTRISSERVR